MTKDTYKDQLRKARAGRLRAARLAAGYKKRSELFARYPSWSRSTYISHELGRRLFDVEFAIQYAKAFKCNPTFLLANDAIDALIDSDNGNGSRRPNGAAKKQP